MNYGKVEEPSSSRSRRKSTARFAATSAILTVILSRSDRAPTSRKADARPGWDADSLLVEDELLRLGAIFEKKANWQPFSIVDGRLITGQNPASSTSAT